MIDSWTLRSILSTFLGKRVAHTRLHVFANFKMFDDQETISSYGSIVGYLGNSYRIEKYRDNCYSVKKIN